jgi:hypothetical protein
MAACKAAMYGNFRESCHTWHMLRRSTEIFQWLRGRCDHCDVPASTERQVIPSAVAGCR